jgi:Caspase domain
MAKITRQFKNGYALLIGVGNYRGPGVSPLPVTVNDAEALYELLTDTDRAGYPVENVKLLTDETASKEKIIDSLHWLATCAAKDPDATIIVFFSGHGGIKDEQYMLLPYDFDWEKWEVSGISKEQFGEKINALQCRKLLVLLDCCHAAGIATKSSIEHQFKASNQALYEALQKGKGRVVMASSRHDQYSQILDKAPYSVFTEALVAALNNNGGNDDGYATVLRTMSYVSEYVIKATKALQTPVFNLESVEDFAICRIANNITVQEQPVKYPGHSGETNGQPAIPKTDLQAFVRYLLELLDDQGFQGVSKVLDAIKESSFEYNKPSLANLRNDAISNLALLSPNSYIVQLRVFIGTLTNKKY